MKDTVDLLIKNIPKEIQELVKANANKLGYNSQQDYLRNAITQLAYLDNDKIMFDLEKRLNNVVKKETDEVKIYLKKLVELLE